MLVVHNPECGVRRGFGPTPISTMENPKEELRFSGEHLTTSGEKLPSSEKEELGTLCGAGIGRTPG